MSAQNILHELQLRQRDHDVKAHKDIYYLPNPERIKHLTFHLAKYAGRLAAPEQGDEKFTSTLVDTFIILLSASELFGLSLPRLLDESARTAEHADLQSLGRALSGVDGGADSRDSYFRKLVSAAGQMSKACEAFDHIEDLPFREIFTRSILELFKATLAAASLLHINLYLRTYERWESVESKISF